MRRALLLHLSLPAGFPAAPAWLCALLGAGAVLPAAAEEWRLATRMAYVRPIVALETGAKPGKVEFAPRTASRPGFEARYGNYGFSLSIPASGGDWAAPDLLTPEGLNDFRVHYHGDAWGVETHHRYARGFYARPEALGAAEVSHPGMVLQSSGATVYRSFDPDSRVYRLSEGMTETGGAIDFFLQAGVSRSSLRDDQPLLAGIRGGTESRFNTMRGMDATSLSLGAGYGFSGNLHGLYFDQALFAGYGPQYREWDGRPDWAWNLAKVNLRMRMGFRTRWFDAGAGFENDAHTAMAGDESAVFHSLAAQAGIEVYL